MKKLHIMVDCDDVLSNTLERWIEYLNERHGLFADAQDIKEGEMGSIFPTLTKDEIRYPLDKPDFSGTYTVKPGSTEVLKEMIDDGHEVSIVTAHNNKTVGTKFEWLEKHFPFLDRDDVLITGKKQKIIGDVLIDDSVKNLTGGSYFKILFDSPTNRSYNAEANDMIRVYSLKQAYDAIKMFFGLNI